MMKPPSDPDVLRDTYFEPMYRDGADPYGVRDRWYEKRKRALLLASLPRRTFTRAFEPACGIGELTLELAARCEHLLACDFSAAAVQTARKNTASCKNVSIECIDFAQTWPAEAVAGFDLIVLSEIGYFLSPQVLDVIAEKCRTSLKPDGVLVACHWLPDFFNRTQSSVEAHIRLSVGLQTLSTHTEADFLLNVWSPSSRSVAQREEIRP
jgi:SAM-dependent methyltransferase